MSVGEDSRNNFASTFNRLMAGKKVAPTYSDAFFKANQGSFADSLAASIQATKTKAPAKKKSSSKSSKSSAPDMTQADKEAYLRERLKEVTKDKQDVPWYKDVANTVLKPLDLLSRPGRTVIAPFDAVGNALLEGEPIWSVGDDAVTAAARAAWGTNKRGGGELVQTMRKLADKQGENTGLGNRIGRNLLQAGGFGAIGKASDAINDANPTAGKWFDRVAGLTVDIGTDPLTYFTGGSKLVAEGAELTGKAAAKGLAAKAAEEAGGAASTIPVAVRNVSRSTRFAGKTGEELVSSGVAAEAKEGAKLLARDAKKLANSQLENTLTRRLLNDEITPDQWMKEMAKISSVRGDLAASNKIRAAASGRTPVDEAAKALLEIRAGKIANSTKSAAEQAKSSIDEALDKVLFETQKRSQAGKVIGANGPEFSRNTAQNIAETYRTALRQQLDTTIKEFETGVVNVKGGTLNTAQLNKLADDVPYFKEWYAGFQKEIRKFKLGRVGYASKSQFDQAAAKGEEYVAKILADETNAIFNTAKGLMDDKLHRIPTIKFAGREVAELPGVGRKLEGLKKSAEANAGYNQMRKALSYNSLFPGYSSRIASKVRSVGMRRFEALRDDALKVIKENNFTAEERRVLQRSLETGTIPTDPRMRIGYDFLRKAYDDMFDREMQASVRNLGATKVQNYAYTRIKPSHRSVDIKDTVEARAKSFRDTGKMDGFASVDLKAKNHKIEEDAFKNLLHRDMISSRDLIKNDFYKDLVTHYSIKAKNLSASEKETRGLVAVNDNKFDKLFSDVDLKPGEKLYIDKEIFNIWNTYTKMASTQPSEESRAFLRSLDFVTRKFKTWNTVYLPGYHVRNMIGDMFMGHMDGVKAKDYQVILNKWPKKSVSNITIGGQSHSFDEFLNAYYDNVGSGTFFDVDLAPTVNIRGRSPASMVRKASEAREDFGRITHFYRAMDDEVGALIKKGMDPKKAWDEGINTAIERVNKFKFDYSALTGFEQNVARRAIPFYTYMRKAVPTLLESIYLNPKYLTNVDRFSQGLEDNWGEDMVIPDYLRQLGFMNIPGTQNWGFTDDLLPTNVIESATRNPVSSLNPVIQTMFEANSGKDTFTGMPIEGDSSIERLPNIIKNKLRPLKLGSDLVTENNKTNVEKIARLLGMPVTRIDQKETDAAYANINFELSKILRKLDESVAAKGYSVYRSNRKSGISLKVKDETTGKVVFEGDSVESVKKFLESL